jgi:voltage-gated potassium channel
MKRPSRAAGWKSRPTKMKSPLRRIRNGGLLLAAQIVLAVVVYRNYGPFETWIEATWFVIISLSSVGYGENSQFPPGLQLFTICLLIVGITTLAYTFGGFLQFLLAGELESILGRERMTREINQLGGHTIVCGFGRIGEILAADLHRHGQPFVLIEQDVEKFNEAQSIGYLCVHGDATEDELLLAAGVHRAKALITGLPTDAANVFITLTARNLNRDLQIIARAEHPTTERKLRQAGANRVVMPATIGAQQMSRMITRPSTADLMELVAEQGNLNVELDELVVSADSPLVGRSIRDTEAHRKFGLLLLSIKQASGAMVFNPEAEHQLAAGDIVILMGRSSDIERFRSEFRL